MVTINQTTRCPRQTRISAMPPRATEPVRRNKTPLSANSGLMHRNKRLFIRSPRRRGRAAKAARRGSVGICGMAPGKHLRCGRDRVSEPVHGHAVVRCRAISIGTRASFVPLVRKAHCEALISQHGENRRACLWHAQQGLPSPRISMMTYAPCLDLRPRITDLSIAGLEWVTGVQRNKKRPLMSGLGH